MGVNMFKKPLNKSKLNYMKYVIKFITLDIFHYKVSKPLTFFRFPKICIFVNFLESSVKNK